MNTSTDDVESIRISRPAEADAVLRIVQVTDCHILASASDRLRGMDTRASFEAVCAAIAEEPRAPDLLLATGDLSQDESAGAYEYLATRFNRLPCPVFWLPGNHDDPQLMREHLRGERISAAKRIEIGDWLILLLDSTIPGETGGHLAETQLAFLETSLSNTSAGHALVCQHHQALPAGSEWIDRLGLEPPNQLADAIRPHECVRGVVWGHVHQQLDRRIDNIDWMSTPSTCMQFKPGSPDFALDNRAPGYRWIELHADGRIDSRVQRLEDDRFIP